MTKEEVIKSLQHAADYMNEHESNRITETTFRGEIIDTVIHKNTLIEAIKLLEEQKTGKWIVIGEPDDNDNIECVCSNCVKRDVHAKNQKVPFCWWCGSKMEAEE